MPSLDIFCLRIFIAFSRLSRTSTSTGFPNVFSMGKEVDTRSGTHGQRSGFVLVEQGDREAMELRVGALGHDLVHDLVIGMAANPISNQLTEELALLGLRCREHFHAGHINRPAVILRGLHTCHGTHLSVRRSSRLSWAPLYSQTCSSQPTQFR